MRKFVWIAVMSVLFTTLLTGCENSATTTSTTNDVNDSMAVIDKINGASEIRAKKRGISFGDSWEIFADGEKVGTVTGQPLYLVGDVYSLISVNGNLVGSETENFKVINSTANIYDYNTENIGSIRQEIFSILSKFEVVENGSTVATSQQKFSLNLSADVKDSGGEVEWKISRDLISFGANVKINKVAGDDVTGMNALWLSLVMNEVFEAQTSKNSNAVDEKIVNAKNIENNN